MCKESTIERATTRAVVVACSCAASAARAQYPQRRDGFWIGFGLGYGTSNVTCDICGTGPRKQAGSGAVRTQWKQNVVDVGLGVTFH